MALIHSALMSWKWWARSSLYSWRVRVAAVKRVMGIHVRVKSENPYSLLCRSAAYREISPMNAKCQMRPTLRSPMLFWLGIGLAVVLSGCEARDESVTPAQSRQIRSDLVPIVRDLPLVPMKEPLVVEFDVPPPGRNSSHALVLGLRVSGKDGKASAKARDDVISSNIKATVILEGPGIASGKQFPLIRTVRSATTDVPNIDLPVGTDGKTQGTWPEDVDSTTIDEAGLACPGDGCRYLGFASARGIPPGRYRLTFLLIHSDTDVSQLPSELVVAYARKPK